MVLYRDCPNLGILQLETEVPIRKGLSCPTKNGVNGDHLRGGGGNGAAGGLRLEMGQERLLFPDPNLCP